MACIKRHRPATWVACCLALVACSGGPERSEVAAADGRDEEGATLLSLDLAHRETSQPLGAELVDPATQNFVEIEIVEVVNPEMKRLSFEVHYQPADGARMLLGTFGLYPPDDPGTFLIATSGKLRAAGALVLSLEVLDDVAPGDELQVKLRPLSLRAQ